MKSVKKYSSNLTPCGRVGMAINISEEIKERICRDNENDLRPWLELVRWKAENICLTLCPLFWLIITTTID